jgi:nucleoside-diphosphate-sugar epimerase
MARRRGEYGEESAVVQILITGNMGYVGPLVVRHLRSVYRHAHLVGLDVGLFAHSLTRSFLPETLLDEQRFADVRDLTLADFDGVDAVVHLAAISNDPIGNRFEAATEEINYHASVRVAHAAAEAGVKRFVFASSCSVYGFAADGRPRCETDALNPLTAYAKSKIATENALHQMNRGGMTVTSLRFATACGMSDRLRLDLVVNDFVASALANGEITVLSDGTPWRPLIDVKDMARAIEWAICRVPTKDGDYLAVNVGTEGWNYQVRQLAEAVAEALPGCRVSINHAAPPDRRSYRVDFELFARLAPEHQPVVTLGQSIRELHQGLAAIKFHDRDFRNSQLIRLKVLDRQIEEGNLDRSLRWRPDRCVIVQ